MVSDNDWTIDGIPRQKAMEDCQVIKVQANACATCPLNPYANQEEAEPLSPFLIYLFELDNILTAQIPLNEFRLSRMDRRAIILLRSMRQDRDLENMRSKRGTS